MRINESQSLGGQYEKVKDLERTRPEGQGAPFATRQEVMDIVYEMLRVYSGDAKFIRPIVLSDLNADPDNKTTGALAVVGGKLKVFDGTNWTIVGTQT